MMIFGWGTHATELGLVRTTIRPGGRCRYPYTLLGTVGLKEVKMKIIPPYLELCGSFPRNHKENIPGFS